MTCRQTLLCLVALTANLTINSAMAADAPIPPVIEFNRDVRPILSETCYACHGPDANKREAELRLDTESGLFGKGAKTKPVVAGKLAESELIKRVTSTAPEPTDVVPVVSVTVPAF